MSEFGQRLRSARELRGLKIEDIAERTRISARFLRAIESETFEELPGGIFNRGFVRNYAEAVGLDGESVVAEYAALAEESARERTEQARATAVPAPSPAAPPAWRRLWLPAAMGGLAVFLIVLYVASRDGAQPAPEPPEPAVPASVRNAPPPAPEAPAPAVQTSPEAAAEPAPGPADGAVEQADEPTPTPPAPAVVAVSGTPRTAGLVVRVEVHDTTWIYVELDGEVMYENITIHPPFFRNYPVEEALELRIGNPEGVSLSVNGRPVSGLGPPGQVWTGTITPENAARLTGS